MEGSVTTTTGPATPPTPSPSEQTTAGSLRKSGALKSPESDMKTLIGGQVQEESIRGGINIMLTPAPIIDPFPAWKPPLCPKEKTQRKGL